VKSPKFKVGDLVFFPDEGEASNKDYGIVIRIISDNQLKLECPYAYEIYWIVEGNTTIDENWWIEENILLKARA
jgi:hypothetical protein